MDGLLPDPIYEAGNFKDLVHSTAHAMICVDHQLQRCIVKALGMDSDTAETREIKGAMARCRALVSYFRNSPLQWQRVLEVGTEIPDYIPKLPKQDEVSQRLSLALLTFPRPPVGGALVR